MTHARSQGSTTAALGTRPERLCAVRTAGACALALAVLAAAACKPPPPPPPPPQPAAATIDGVALPLSRVQAELDRLRLVTGPAGTPTQTPVAQGRALLDQLIDQRLVVARAKRERLLVSDADAQTELDELAEAARAAGQTLKERLAAEGTTEEELTQEIRERVLAERWLSQQLKVERPGAQEVKAAYDKALKDARAVPGSELLVDVPEQVRCAQILVGSAPEAKAILDQARKGTAFEQLARKHSQSPDRDQGGDLGFFSRGSLPPPFDDCFALQKNQLSGVLASKYGFHLLKLLDRRPRRRRTLAEATPALEKLLVAERRTQAERALLSSLRRAARIEIHEDVLAGLH